MSVTSLGPGAGQAASVLLAIQHSDYKMLGLCKKVVWKTKTKTNQDEFPVVQLQ